MPSQKVVWVKNLFGHGAPWKFPGKFQAGATQAISRGDFIVISGGNWVPLAADQAMAATLAFSDMDIISGDAAGFHEIIIPRPGDVFEATLNAAATVTAGTALYWNASQTLTATAGTNILGYALDETVYPLQGTARGGSLSDAGVTSSSRSVVRFVVKAAVSYYAAVIL